MREGGKVFSEMGKRGEERVCVRACVWSTDSLCAPYMWVHTYRYV